MRLQERFQPIYTYYGMEPPVTFYDVAHFDERTTERALIHLNVSRSHVTDAFQRGVRKIKQDWDFAIGDYMVISPKVGIKIPITILTNKKSSTHELIGLVPTLLLVDSPYDRQRDYYKNVLIESKELFAYALFEGTEDFIDFYEDNERIPSYEEIYV
jgi:hypothetical protein